MTDKELREKVGEIIINADREFYADEGRPDVFVLEDATTAILQLIEKERAELQAEVERLKNALEIKTIAFKGEFDEHVEDCKNYQAKLDVAREALKPFNTWNDTEEDAGDPCLLSYEACKRAKQALEKLDD